MTARGDRRDVRPADRDNPADAGLDERAAKALANENEGPAGRRLAAIGVRALVVGRHGGGGLRGKGGR